MSEPISQEGLLFGIANRGLPLRALASAFDAATAELRKELEQARAQLAEAAEWRKKATEWNKLTELEIGNLRSLQEGIEKDREEEGEAWEQLAATFPAIQVDCENTIEAAQFIVSEYERVEKDRNAQAALAGELRKALVTVLNTPESKRNGFANLSTQRWISKRISEALALTASSALAGRLEAAFKDGCIVCNGAGPMNGGEVNLAWENSETRKSL